MLNFLKLLPAVNSVGIKNAFTTKINLRPLHLFRIWKKNLPEDLMRTRFKKYFIYGIILFNLVLYASVVKALYIGNNSPLTSINDLYIPRDLIAQYFYPSLTINSYSYPYRYPASGGVNLFSPQGEYTLPSINTNNLFNPVISNSVFSSNFYYASIGNLLSQTISKDFIINPFWGPFTPFFAGSQLQSYPAINNNLLLNQVRAEIVVPPINAIPNYSYTVVNVYPHDRNAFTQGLVFENGFLYEGTGLIGQSSLRKVELETGTVLQIRELPAPYFGEGITIYGNRIIQLTWLSKVGFVYDKNSFELLQEFSYSTAGWGITHDGKRLIMSDGTSRLHFLDPFTFEEIGWIEVYDLDGPVTRLNELEYIHGEIYANVWQTNRIARISPLTGQVVGWIDLAGLLSPEGLLYPVDVLNGIAYNPIKNRLLVTGKLWPKLFEIELIPLPVL